MRRALFVSISVLALVVIGLPNADARPKPPPLEIHHCGDTVHHSFRLANDITDCGPLGLVAAQGAKAYTIDLNGHAISTNGTGNVGITTDPGNVPINVKNGVIKGFAVGVDVQGDHASVRSLVVINSSQSGIQLDGSHDTASGNTLTRNDVGVQSNGDNNTISGNTADGNSTGIAVAQANNNVVSANSTVGNSSNGILLDAFAPGGADGNSFRGNTTIGNGSDGLTIANGASDTTVKGNIARGNAGSGVAVSASQTTTVGDGTATGSNLSDANGSDGFEITGSIGAGNTLNRNIAIGNRDNGIYGDSSFDSYTNNTASQNGANGIQLTQAPVAVSGNTTDGNGWLNGLDNTGFDFGILIQSGPPPTAANEASHNASGANQCSPTSACTAGGSTLAPDTTECNDVINAAGVLVNPLDCTVGNLTINGTGPFTVNLGDHFIHTHQGGTNAIDLGGSNITVTGGVIRAEDGDAIDIATGTGDTVSSFVVSNGKWGVATEDGSSGNTFSNGVLTQTADRAGYIGGTNNKLGSAVIAGVRSVAGVIFFGNGTTTGPKLTALTVIGTAGRGIQVESAEHAAITGSSMIGNASDGLHVNSDNGGDTSGTTFSLNKMIANDDFGVHDVGDPSGTGDTNNRYVKNLIKDNGDDGFRIDSDPDSTGNVISGNTVSANGGDAGIYIASQLDGTHVLGNKSSNNDVDGIDVENNEPGIVVSNNRTLHNGWLDPTLPPDFGIGILAPDGTHGCGNVAKHNHDPDQILPHSLLKACPKH